MPIGPMLKGAGDLRFQVSLQSPTTVVDALGGRTQTWSTYAEHVPACVEPQPFIVPDKAEVLEQVTIRYRSDVEPEHRLIFRTKTYEIVLVVNIGERNRQLQLQCAEITA